MYGLQDLKVGQNGRGEEGDGVDESRGFVGHPPPGRNELSR